MAGGEQFYINQIRNWKPSNKGGLGWLILVVAVFGILLYLGLKYGKVNS